MKKMSDSSTSAILNCFIKSYWLLSLHFFSIWCHSKLKQPRRPKNGPTGPKHTQSTGSQTISWLQILKNILFQLSKCQDSTSYLTILPLLPAAPPATYPMNLSSSQEVVCFSNHQTSPLPSSTPSPPNASTQTPPILCISPETKPVSAPTRTCCSCP